MFLNGLLIGGGITLFCVFLGFFHILVPIIGWGIGCLIMYLVYENNRNKQYKDEVMPQIVNSICPGATYHPDGNISKKVIEAADLYEVHDYRNEDTIRGKIDKTDFVYGEVTLSHVESNGKNTRTVIDFQGFVFDADFNKDFKGITKLSTEKVHLSAHSLFSALCRCKLEDVNFEKTFSTYSTNDQEARYILSPALQQRILEMYDVFRSQLCDRDLSISFHHGRMTIMVPSSTNRFEVKYTVDEVKKDFIALCIMVDIVEMLNLNLRIWTKE